MKLGKKQIVSVIFLLAVMLTIVVVIGQSCAPSNSPPASYQSNAKEALSASPAFKVSLLTINPPETNPGVQVIVTAKVTNTGSTKVSYTPKIRIDDIDGGSLPSFRYLKDIEIPAGITQPLSFVVPTDTPGKYKVTWGELTGEFAVIGADKTDTGNYTAAKAIAPDFTAVDVVTNQKITLSQFKGSMVLLNFVNYGCDPSLNNIVSKQLLAIKALKNQRTDFTPVSVFCGCCPPEVLRDFAKQNDLSWPWILDTDNSIVRKYISYLRKYGYPTLVFIDQDQLVRQVSGYSDLTALSAKFDQILGQSN